jgi:hypothetical protein
MQVFGGVAAGLAEESSNVEKTPPVISVVEPLKSMRVAGDMRAQQVGVF